MNAAHFDRWPHNGLSADITPAPSWRPAWASWAAAATGRYPGQPLGYTLVPRHQPFAKPHVPWARTGVGRSLVCAILLATFYAVGAQDHCVLHWRKRPRSWRASSAWCWPTGWRWRRVCGPYQGIRSAVRGRCRTSDGSGNAGDALRRAQAEDAGASLKARATRELDEARERLRTS